jgi:hypothetical protein
MIGVRPTRPAPEDWAFIEGLMPRARYVDEADLAVAFQSPPLGYPADWPTAFASVRLCADVLPFR